MSKGELLKEICGLSDDYMESSYKEAMAMLENSDFEGEREMFYNLCLFDKPKPKYWGGLGKCCEGLKQYKEAIGMLQNADSRNLRKGAFAVLVLKLLLY